MRFCSLGSGSTGNATVIEASAGATVSRVAVDCGFSLREFDTRLQRAGLTIDALDAVFVTHEHGDHVGCAVSLARRHRVPVWMSRGTWHAIGEPDLDGQLHFARDAEAIAVGDIELTPYTVPHDAAEPLQLRIGDGQSTLGVLTDAGSRTPHMLAHLQACNALLLECNHDAELLAQSRYPPSLKARIAGSHGHLSNTLAAQILAECLHSGLRHVVAAHLSEQNNRPALAQRALAEGCGGTERDIAIADPAMGFGWLNLR